VGLGAPEVVDSSIRRAAVASGANNGGVQRNRSELVAWNERDDGRAIAKRPIGRKVDNIGVMGDSAMVRRLGCIVMRERVIYGEVFVRSVCCRR
jgi:hypothetical protein